MTSKERASFRAQANTLDPIFQVGKGGVTEAVASQTDNALRTKELIKIRVLLETCPQKPKEVAERLAAATGADVIRVIGGVIVLYRYSPELHEKKKKTKSNGIKGHGIRQNKARKAQQERREKKEERAYGRSNFGRNNRDRRTNSSFGSKK